MQYLQEAIETATIQLNAQDRSVAERLDELDELKDIRGEFSIPKDGALYFCGNSLGLQPREARTLVEYELDQWAERGVEGHLHGTDTSVRPWLRTDENVTGLIAEVVGAEESEVAVMNGLTANLHLMMVSFYRPEGRRVQILMESRAFPSDIYAVETHLVARGQSPETALVTLSPREGESCLRTEDIEAKIAELGDSLALVLFSGVQYYTGQWFDMQRITAAAHAQGALAGFDCAHAAGNVPLRLHEWNVDFAVWCSYKYLNSGPGGIAGVFVHARHAHSEPMRPRFAGWWGHDLGTRFAMDEPFTPIDGAMGYRLSNPPVFQMAAHLGALRVLKRAGGMSAFRKKSYVLTAYLEYLLRTRLGSRILILTPSDPSARGCQLSVQCPGHDAEKMAETLLAKGVVVDYRKPDVIRISPVPLYNRFTDVFDLLSILESLLSA